MTVSRLSNRGSASGRARPRRRREFVPNCIPTAMLDKAQELPRSPRLTVAETTAQVTPRTPIGTAAGEERSRPKRVRSPEARAERYRGVVTIIPKAMLRAETLVPAAGAGKRPGSC